MAESTKTLQVGALVVAAFVAGWWLSKTDAPEPTPPPVVESAPEQLDVPQATQWTPRPNAVGGAPVSVVPAREGGEDLAEHARHKAAQVAENEARWSSDTATPADSAAVEKQFLDVATDPAMASLRFKPLDYSVKCRKGMCRVDTLFAPGAQTNEWTMRMQLGLGGVVGNVVTLNDPQPDGSMKTVMYAYRLGTPMPR